MANEATLVENPTIIRDFTVNDLSAMEQYTLCRFTDPRTAVASTAGDKGLPFAGILMSEKKASDGATNVGFAQDGVFKLTSAPGAAIAAGAKVVMSGINTIMSAVEADEITGAIVGTCLEAFATGASNTGEVDIGNR